MEHVWDVTLDTGTDGVESVLLSYVARRPLYLLTGFRMAANRAMVMRRTAFERVAGYDPEMLTEYFAFAYACYRAHLDVHELGIQQDVNRPGVALLLAVRWCCWPAISSPRTSTGV